MLSPDELTAFERDGFVPLGRIAGPEQIDALLAAEERFRPAQAYAAAGSASKLLVRDQLAHHSVAVREMCLMGAHVTVLGQLLGPDVAFTHTQFITKLPDDGEVDSWIPLHQDDGYGLLDPPIDVTVWMALTDTDERNGCLVIVPGSHTHGVIEHAKAPNNPALRQAEGDGAIALPLRAGEAVAFSGLTLHGSGPNRTGAPRIGMHMRYCLPTARMMTEGGKPVLADAHSWMVLGEAPDDDWASANEKFTSGRV